MPVEISTSTAYVKSTKTAQALNSITVMAHFDTGAIPTSIDISLATHLNLIPTGSGTSMTAAGEQIMPNYAIDISFPNTPLRSFTNLNIGSCNLPFDIDGNLLNTNNPVNFGILLGRDIMSSWNIIWNVPTSSIISFD